MTLNLKCVKSEHWLIIKKLKSWWIFTVLRRIEYPSCFYSSPDLDRKPGIKRLRNTPTPTKSPYCSPLTDFKLFTSHFQKFSYVMQLRSKDRSYPPRLHNLRDPIPTGPLRFFLDLLSPCLFTSSQRVRYLLWKRYKRNM